MDICHQSIMFVLVGLELTWHFIGLTLNGFVQFLHCNQIDMQVLSSVWELKCGGLCYRVLHSRTCFRYYVCTVSLHLEEYLLHFWDNNIHSFHNILCSSTVQIQEWICGVCSKLKKGNNWSQELWLQKNTSLEDPSKVLICVKLPVFVLTIFKCVLSSTLNLWMRLLEQHS